MPAAVVAKLGSSKKPAVSVTIKGYTCRSTVASMGRRFLLPISAQVREGAGVAAGQKWVDVETDIRDLRAPHREGGHLPPRWPQRVLLVSTRAESDEHPAGQVKNPRI